ncbi:MAG: adenylate/guanylate cyclase domain-containing protein [Verrucomicrobia bacterium]|nr:adenylate/guanylate cyclase domain-containing protein [Verrucomicrobiota bacterium]
MSTKLKVIMFTDRGRSSHVKNEAIRTKITEFQDQFTHEVAMVNHGVVIKPLGDGHLLTFDAAIDAVNAGLDLQKKIVEHNAERSNPHRFQLRIGIDAGDVQVGGNGDVLGHYADMASRVEKEGKGIKSPVILTERVHGLLPRGTVVCRELRTVKLKGSEDLIALYQAIKLHALPPQPRRKLSAYLTGEFLQVLLRKFALIRSDSGLQLQVDLEGPLEVITSNLDKQDFFNEVSGETQARNRLIADIAAFKHDHPHLQSFDCKKWPLRYANGGTLPVVCMNGFEYVCLFYRDVYPVGWNIANGASDSYVELYDPERIIHREFGEELIVADHAARTLFFYSRGVESIGPGYQEETVVALDKQYPDFGFDRYNLVCLPVTWMEGPDSVKVRIGKGQKVSSGFFLSVTPQDSAIEVDRAACINLHDNCSLLDGEMGHGKLVGRLVGLFRMDHMVDQLSAHEFMPDVYFCDAQPGAPSDFKERVRKSVRAIQRFRRTDQKEQYDKTKHKFDLCPITRALLSRYFEWKDGHAEV